MKKGLKYIGIGIVSIATIMALVVGILFYPEVYTHSTFKVLNEHPFYEMTYHADYGLDKFLEKGAATDDELVSFVTKQILKGLPLEANPGGACSTFIATNQEGDALFGRNFDYYPSSGLITIITPENGYKSIAVSNLAHIGLIEDRLPTNGLINKITTLAAPYIPLDGMNEKGLAIGVLVIEKGVVHQATGKVPITTTSAIRMILDKAATVQEAVELLQNYDMNSSGSTGYHFQIADASGDTAIVEYIDNEMRILTKEDGHVAATNFVLYNNLNEGTGQERYAAIMKKQTESKGILSEEECLDLLLSIPPKDSQKVVDGKVYPFGTQWSCVYNLDDLSVDICVGTNKEQVYTYSLK